MTAELAKRIEKYPLYFQDGKGSSAKILCKFFTPMANFTWYVLEGNKLPDGDYEFFGIVDGYEREYGYFRLSELKGLKKSITIRGVRFDMSLVERDMYFKSATVGEVLGKWGYED